MKNSEVVKLFWDHTNGATISRLFWVAGSTESSELKELLEQLEDFQWYQLFPEGIDYKNLQDAVDNDEPTQVLVDFGKFGFIAEVYFPQCTRFLYDEDGNPSSWMRYSGFNRIELIYAETTDELAEAIKNRSKTVFEEMVKEDKTSRKEKEVKNGSKA